MRVAVGVDHGGFPLKGVLVEVLRAEGAEEGEIPPPDRLCGLSNAEGRCDHLGEGNQTFEMAGRLGTNPLLPVGQLLHAVEHAHRHPAPAHGADPSCGPRLGGLPPDTTRPVSIIVIFALLREELQGSQKAGGIAASQGFPDGGIRKLGIEEICLACQVPRGVSIGIGDQGETIQAG